MQVTKNTLLARIKKFLEFPGICPKSKRATILEDCEKASFEKLCEISVMLRIRTRKIASIANSPEKIQEIKSVMDSLDKFFTKYEIQS